MTFLLLYILCRRSRDCPYAIRMNDLFAFVYFMQEVEGLSLCHTVMLALVVSIYMKYLIKHQSQVIASIHKTHVCFIYMYMYTSEVLDIVGPSVSESGSYCGLTTHDLHVYTCLNVILRMCTPAHCVHVTFARAQCRRCTYMYVRTCMCTREHLTLLM